MAERDGERRVDARGREERALPDRALEEERVRVRERALGAAVHALVEERAGGLDAVEVDSAKAASEATSSQQRADAAADVDDPPGRATPRNCSHLRAAPVSKARAYVL